MFKFEKCSYRLSEKIWQPSRFRLNLVYLFVCFMRKLCTSLLILLNFAFISYAQQSHIPGKVMVMLNPEVDVKKTVQGLNENHPGANFNINREVTAEWNIWLLEFDNHFISDESALLLVNHWQGVTMAQFDYPVQLRVTTPNDPSFAQQWALNNTGQNGGTADADVDAPEAWDITTGGNTVNGDTIVVAVIDGGFQGDHPDLAANYWKNYAEIPGNGIDDDGNGYIDDTDGWDAFNNDGSLPTDLHGTHVAGIIGAKGDNATGISGVNWNVKIMRVAGSSGNTSTVVAAYGYVAKQRKLYNQTNGAAGAFVVSTNSSFGVDFGQATNYPIWCAFYDTLGTLGILSAGAGPNSNTNVDTQGDIPTTCPSKYLIGVTNTRRNDTRNPSSGYGPINIDIGAPGTEIYSTVAGSSYSNLTGTSMATPHVAGAIGLYYSAACSDFINNYKSNPGPYALLMRSYVLRGVDSISAMSATTSSKGRLNLFKGVQHIQIGCLDVPPPPPVVAFSFSDSSICVGEQITFTDQSTNAPTAWNWTFSGGTPGSSTNQNPTVTYNTAGTYNVSLVASNDGGSGSQVSNALVTVHANPSAPIITDLGGIFESSYSTGNQWYGPNGMVAGATSNTFTPPSNGLYYVTYTDVNGCVSSTSASILQNASIEEVYFEALAIYPNPVITNQFTISWKSSNAQVSGMRLYDVIGRLIYQENTISDNTLVISMDEFAAGNYMVEIITTKGSVKKRLVKN